MFSVKRSAVAASQTKASELSEEEEQHTSPLILVTSTLQTPPPSSPLPITGASWPASDSKIVTGGLANSLGGSTLSRVPMIIKGELKRSEPLPPPSPEARKKHSKRLWILGTVVLVMTIAATLLVTTPQGQELSAKLVGPAPNSGTLVSGQQSNGASVSALATTTYMYENDGYDPYSHGQVNVSDGKSSLPWPYGQCTYWANYRYHQLTGYWVQWTGDADQWFLGAQKAGWDSGQTPPVGVPSIIVLMPYVQGASWLGHVAVVESRTGNVVHTSNMNWGYGGYTHVEDVDFTLGPGVYFVWHPAIN